ncbi:MAG: D-aminoacyl-tRNA deacylase [Oribacterium sp.]|nr:D-aminoacyl-tRNA deacylase [Oribacterium sp.]
MRAVVTRVKEASVSIDGVITGLINKGFLILIGVHENDTEDIAKKIADKICGLRVFEDSEGKMNINTWLMKGTECDGIGKRIRYLREKAGITQQKLAEIVGVSSVHISNVETGTALPGVEVVVRMANYFGVTTDWILRENIPGLTDKLGDGMAGLISDCSPSEREFYENVLKNTKKALREYEKDGMKKTARK